jgi:Family of unknown function (DUF6299)
MRRFIAAIVAGIVGTVGLTVVGTPAFAAPPVNDAFGDRVPVDLGSPVGVDTSEATVEAHDIEATSACPVPPGSPPATTNTIWFDWNSGATPPSQLAVMLTNATFAAGAAVVTGDPGSFTTVACGGGIFPFSPAPDTTYHVMVFDFLGAGGGTALLAIDELPPPPTLSLTVDPIGRFDSKTGTATLTGTYNCTNAFFTDISGSVRQAVGRFVIRGTFFTGGVDCDGEAHTWTALVVADNGKFAGGKAMSVAFGFACGVPFCTSTLVEQAVQLKGR